MVIFTSRRNKPEVVVPAQATPREVKTLSDMDNQVGVRVYLTALHFFRLAAPEGQEPDQVASTLKDALARALVYYYPLAGRAREVPGAGGKKLVVDCSAEGAVFVEAHADVRLEELGKPVVKPHPCIVEFMCDVGDVRDVVNKPLLYLQMTQLGCGGVVLALSVSHSLVDVTGMYQVLRCITDLARGQAAPTVLPTWERQLLVASSQEEEAEEEEAKAATMTPPPPSLNDAVVTRYFLFGPREMAALRTAVPAATVFELITAAVWRCRAMALQYPPQQTVRLFFMVNGRGAWKCDPPLPRGFYGNAGFITNAESSAAELYGAPLDHAVGLVHQAKLRFTDQRVRSYLAMMPRGKHSHGPEVALHWSSFIVSDVTRCVDDSLDIGSWAQHVGGGPAVARDMGLSSPCVLKSCKETNGDKCVLVPICLPELAMGRFASQIAALTGRSSC